MEERTERESDRRRREHGRLVGAAKTSKEIAEWRRLQRKNFPENERVASVAYREQLASTSEPPFLKGMEKEQSHLSKVPDRKVGESQGKREPHLGERERERDQNESMERKRWTPL